MATRGLRKPALLVLVASLAMLVFFFSGNETATATTNAVGYPASLSSTATGANADVTTKLQLPAPTSFPAGGTVSGTPNGWGVATDTADLSASPVNVPDGAVAGSLTAKVQLAVNVIGANACFIPVEIPFAMVDSTVDQTTSTIGGSPAAVIWPGNADANADGLPDGVTKWPTFLNAHLANLNPGGPAPVPIARYHGQILVAPPSPTNLELLYFAPGSVPGYPASMGTISVSYLEDSLAPAAPSAISMQCTAAAPTVFVTTKILGSSGGAAKLLANPSLPPAGGSLVQFVGTPPILFPGAEKCDGIDNNGVNGTDEGCGFLLRQNPSAAGSYLYSIAAITDRDTDNDGIENDLDKCPLHVDANATPGGGPFPFFGLGYNPRWGAPPFFPFPQPADLDDDNLPASCDPAPLVPSLGLGSFGLDEDGDGSGVFSFGFSNGQDNCPLVFDYSQADSEILELDEGTRIDSIGDACDPNPSISDGHAHRNFGLGPVCVGAVDADADGWCASEDSNDASAAATAQVENIAFPQTCGDGVDNDGVGGTDLADTGCQQTNHDLRFFPPQVNGLATPLNGGTNDYQVMVRNGTASPEVARLGFLIDETAAGLADGCSATITSLTSPGLVAGTDKVGAINHDSGGYPVAQTAALGSAATDMELEPFATAEVAVGGNAVRPVRISVTWSCTAAVPAVGAADFTVNVDMCHPGDPTLGLFPPLNPLGSECGLTGADGGQDRVNTGNDATISQPIDVQ